MTTTEEYDVGMMHVLLERFTKQRLPRALEMKEKVDRGETLDSRDIEFLKEISEDTHSLQGLLERHPEYESIAAQGLNLYTEITQKAIANAKAES